MRNIPDSSDPTFQSFVAKVTESAFVEQLAASTGWPETELARRLTVAVGESAQTLRVLAGLSLPDSARIIEVGAGLGLTSTFLSTCGFDVTALEPGGVGFEEHRAVAMHVATLIGAEHEVLTIGAESLASEVHGRFDLIFSNNVIEHVADPVAVLRTLASAVTAGGLMVHSCPNYSVPFEPHFGIPLVPGRPRWTRKLLPASIADSDVWASLNFVRARDVVEVGRDLGWPVAFRTGALAASVDRLGTDAEFRSRHRVLATIASVLRRVGFVAVIRRLPPNWSTPMDFAMASPETDPARVKRWLGGLG